MILNRKINIILAADIDDTIGRHNELPWRLKSDMEFFKKTTTGHVVLMGRKTFDAVGKPLPGRYNIVVTRDPNWSFEGVSVLNDIDEALLEAALIADDRECEVFIIGGAEIYKQTVHSCDHMYFTRVLTTTEGGDAFFKCPPEMVVTRVHHLMQVSKDEHNEFAADIYRIDFDTGEL